MFKTLVLYWIFFNDVTVMYFQCGMPYAQWVTHIHVWLVWMSYITQWVTHLCDSLSHTLVCLIWMSPWHHTKSPTYVWCNSFIWVTHIYDASHRCVTHMRIASHICVTHMDVNHSYNVTAMYFQGSMPYANATHPRLKVPMHGAHCRSGGPYYIDIYTYIYIYIYVHIIHICVYIYIYIYIYVYTYTYIHIYIYICTYKYMTVYIRVFICIYQNLDANKNTSNTFS